MTEPYRFGGPIPESVQRLKKRREWRASSLFATVKRGRARERAETAAAPSEGDWARAAMAPFAHLMSEDRLQSPFREEGAEACMPVSRVRSESWLQSIARIFRGGR